MKTLTPKIIAPEIPKYHGRTEKTTFWGHPCKCHARIADAFLGDLGAKKSELREVASFLSLRIKNIYAIIENGKSLFVGIPKNDWGMFP